MLHQLFSAETFRDIFESENRKGVDFTGNYFAVLEPITKEFLDLAGAPSVVASVDAEHDPPYLLAKVEVVATYKLAGISRARRESLFHRLFEPARLSITINDRFGHPVQPEEWFLFPLLVIGEAVARIKDGSIAGYIHDPSAASLVKA